MCQHCLQMSLLKKLLTSLSTKHLGMIVLTRPTTLTF